MKILLHNDEKEILKLIEKHLKIKFLDVYHFSLGFEIRTYSVDLHTLVTSWIDAFRLQHKQIGKYSLEDMLKPVREG